MIVSPSVFLISSANIVAPVKLALAADEYALTYSTLADNVIRTRYLFEGRVQLATSGVVSRLRSYTRLGCIERQSQDTRSTEGWGRCASGHMPPSCCPGRVQGGPRSTRDYGLVRRRSQNLSNSQS